MKAEIYPVITLYQPWATWIMREWKTIETRTHNRFSSLVGKTILIHAGMTTDETAINNPYLTKEQLLENPDEMVNGFILGSVYIGACGWLCGDNYENKNALIETTNRYGLFLKNIEKFDSPIPCKGEMGIWYFDMNKKEKIKKPKLQTNLF
jgi:hypothetical protein